MLNKTLLGSAAVIMTMVGAQAADLPSKKAAPATYVKICDTYGAGFFTLPGTDTCVKLAGYVRYELTYTPAKDLLAPNATAAAAAVAGSAPGAGTYVAPKNAQVAGANVTQAKQTMDTYGTEYRGRIEVDARTPTSYGTARTVIALRGTGATGLNSTAYDYNASTVANTFASTNAGLTMEKAFVQWAGFTAGIASSNYAMIPSMTYKANIWAGFPNGMRQLSYTAVLGGGFSATLALEDKQMWGNDAAYSTGAGLITSTNINKPDTIIAPVANIRLDQAWGWAAVHGVMSKHSLSNNLNYQSAALSGLMAFQALSTNAVAYSAESVTKSGYSIGTTVNFKLDMIAKGDQVWLTANYMNGLMGGLMSGSITSPSGSSSGGRMMGGVIRQDGNVIFTGVNPTTGANTGYDTTTGWNVGGQFLHFWAPQWRSVFTAGYAEVNPPTQAQTAALAWGKGTVAEGRGNLIFSPVKDFDIGLEIQYMRNTNKLQNTTTVTAGTAGAAWVAQGLPGLNNNNWSGKFRVERSF